MCTTPATEAVMWAEPLLTAITPVELFTNPLKEPAEAAEKYSVPLLLKPQQ